MNTKIYDRKKLYSCNFTILLLAFKLAEADLYAFVRARDGFKLFWRGRGLVSEM